MEYRCISADCHIDLCWLPHELFVSRASAAMKDRMPFVVQQPAGPRWVTNSGLDLGFANGKGGTGTTGAGGTQYVPGQDSGRDRMEATGLLSDGTRDILRPTTPELRIQDQDRDGIQAEVMYGVLGTGTKLTDYEAAVEFYRIYNEWLVEFCSYDSTRFVGLASIPSHSVEAAVTEAQHAAKLGLGGLDIAFSWNMTPLWNPYWEPFWSAAADVNLPVHFHTVGMPPEPPVPDDLPEDVKIASRLTRNAGFQLYMARILAAVINSGALERHPRLRIVLGESGIGWIPYVLDRMDYEFADRFRSRALTMKPSDYWRRQCRATFQYDRIGTKLLDDLGIENVMWGSDYPHPDGVFPESQECIQRQFGDLAPEARRKITCENVGKFYGLIPE